MPNHAHLLINTQGYTTEPSHKGTTAPYPLADILKQLKGRTARFCNQVLGRSGPFWQHESYDHVVRSPGDLGRIIAYILNNPVKARLVTKWTDWPFTYLKEDLTPNNFWHTAKGRILFGWSKFCPTN
jgi:REP element-mobilizing transposase RayT